MPEWPSQRRQNGRNNCAKEEHTDWLLNTKWSRPEIVHTSNIQTEQHICRNRCIYTYMHVMTMDQKKGHEFERDHGVGAWQGLEGRRGKGSNAESLKIQKKVYARPAVAERFTWPGWRCLWSFLEFTEAPHSHGPGTESFRQPWLKLAPPGARAISCDSSCFPGGNQKMFQTAPAGKGRLAG